jgi:trans-aconitate methyltransferase
MSTWQSDKCQRTQSWYVSAPHVGHDIEDVVASLDDIGFHPRTLTDIGCGSGRLVVALASKFPSLVATGYDADELVLDFARELVRIEGLEHRCQFVKQDVAGDPPNDRSDLTTFLAVRGLYPRGDHDLIRAMSQLTSANGLAVVDGIWTTRDDMAANRILEFTQALIDTGATILCRKERTFTLQDSHVHSGRPNLAVRGCDQGVSSLWLVTFGGGQ